MDATRPRRKLNDDYGIFYNQTHDSPSSSARNPDETLDNFDLQVMSRVDWIVALRNIFHRLQRDGMLSTDVLHKHLKMANFDLVSPSLYELSHESHEKGYSLQEVLTAFDQNQH